MRIAPVLSLLAGLAVVAWIAPGLRAGEDLVASADIAQSEGEGAGKAPDRAAWLAGETVLDRAGDGHFYSDIRVNGALVHALVDTGASTVALTGADARAAGLDWREEDLVPVARGASGVVYGVPVKLEAVELGGIEVEGVMAAVVPEGLDVSLLGQSVLSHLSGVRIEGDRMVLGGG